ncbi:MAG: hypothetical protein IPL22_22145 [Bacteroidetes bacterium]|nr:hypothetical protein [Bacteroidota bacterium]
MVLLPIVCKQNITQLNGFCDLTDDFITYQGDSLYAFDTGIIAATI